MVVLVNFLVDLVKVVVVVLNGSLGVGVGFRSRSRGGFGGANGGSRLFYDGSFGSRFGSESLVAGGW